MRKLMALVPALALIMTGCGGTKDDRGLTYMPDMYDSPAKKSQETFVVQKENADGEVVAVLEVPTMLDPPVGATPRNFVPYEIPNTNDGLLEAMKLSNPISPTSEVLKRGAERYNIFCAVCHGEDGNVANSYVAGPNGVIGIVSINTNSVKAMPDGQIYHIITHGRNRMPSYAAQLLPEDRWAVIHYLRALGVATNAQGDELKALEALDYEQSERFEPLPEPVPEYDQERWPESIQREAK